MKISIETKNYRTTHTTVRIPYQDLVKKLEHLEQSNIEITAKSNGYDFCDVNDIRANPESFCGFPDLKIGGTTISFGSNNTVIWLYHETAADGDQEIARNLSDFLTKYERKIVGWAERYSYSIMILIALSIVPLMLAFEKLTEHDGRIALAIVMLPYMIFVLYLISTGFTAAVYDQTRDTFWQRNKDKIFLMLISGLIGACLTWAGLK